MVFSGGVRKDAETREEEALLIAEYMLFNESTVRQAAKEFGLTKSTTHLRIHKDLPLVSAELHSRVKELFEYNMKERLVRAAKSTRRYHKCKAYKGKHPEATEVKPLNCEYCPELVVLYCPV